MAASQEDRLAGRNGSIWRDYCSGRNQEWLAARYGLSQQRVSQICSSVREVMTDSDREDWRVKALETLYEMHAAAVELVRAPLPPLVQSGKVVYAMDGDPEPLSDAAPRLSAIHVALKVQERAARTLGTDSPEQYRSDQTVHYTINGVDPEELK